MRQQLCHQHHNHQRITLFHLNQSLVRITSYNVCYTKLLRMKQYYEDNHKKLHDELSALKNKPVEVAVAEPSAKQLEKIRADLDKELREEYFSETQLAVKRADEAEQKLHAELQKAEKEKSDLERKLKAGTADESKVAFKVYFQNIQENFRKFVEVIDTVEDFETKGKFKGAVKTYLNT